MPLNTLQCTGPLPVTTSYPAPNVSGVRFEVSGLRSQGPGGCSGFPGLPCTALRSEAHCGRGLLRSPATSQVCSAPLHTWVCALGHGRGGVPKGPRNSRVAQPWTPWLHPYSRAFLSSKCYTYFKLSQPHSGVEIAILLVFSSTSDFLSPRQLEFAKSMS